MPLPWGCAVFWSYVVSLGVGTAVTFFFHKLTVWLEDRETPKDSHQMKILQWGGSSVITGVMERLIFTPFVLISPENAVQAMGGWLALKMAATWQRDKPEGVRQHYWINRSFLGLQTGFLSLAFAACGGLLARYLIGIDVLAIPAAGGGR